MQARGKMNPIKGIFSFLISYFVFFLNKSFYLPTNSRKLASCLGNNFELFELFSKIFVLLGKKNKLN